MKGPLRLLLFCFLTFAIVRSGHGQIINTIAGTGTAGLSGDGGAATAAMIHNSYYGGVTLDTSGNIYIGDYGNSLIRKLTPAGIITTIAGIPGLAGTTGDGGPATAARVACPIGLAIDKTGSLYLCGYNVHLIRKINASGIISTIVGNGSPGFSGDGGPATAAQINQAWGIAADTAGNLYIADQYNHRIRKINTSGIISTIAGTGIAGFSGDGGQATAAQLRYPVGITVDRAGNVYVTDLNDCRVRKISTSGIISTYAGMGSGSFAGDGGPATAAYFYNPSGITVDTSGNVFIADTYNNRIRRINAAGTITTIAGSGSTGAGTGGFGGDGGAAVGARLDNPYSVVTDPYGRVIIADNFNERVRMVSGNDRVPYFTGGASQSFHVCQNSFAGINSILAVVDSDAGQLVSWALLSAPAHGTAAVSWTMPATGFAVTPSGITYTPTTGYSGADSFRVTASDGLLYDTITIYATVDPLPPAITGTMIVCTGGTTLLSDTTTGGSWSSGSTLVATISPTGLVSGVTGGTSVITYTLPTGCATTATVTVYAYPAGITGVPSVCPGSYTTLFNTTSGGLWTSTTPGIATIGSTSGTVMGVTTGISVVSYTVGGICSVTKPVTVNPAPSVISGTRMVCSGNVTSLTDIPTGGTWTTSSTALAVGSSSGLVYGVSAGTGTVTYSIGIGCVATATVTVFTTPVSISGANSLCRGTTITLTNSTSGGAWSSSAPAIGTISTTGVFAGLSPGVDTVSYTTGGICVTNKVATVFATPSVITGSTYLICVGSYTTLSDSVSGGNWTSSSTGIASVGSASGIVSGLSVGTANITYTLPGTCRAVRQVTVTGAPGAITGTATICGTSSSWLAAGPGGGTWTSSSPGVASVGSSSGIVTGVLPGTSLITYGFSSGCSSSLTVTVNAAPGPVTGPPSVCQGNTITLSDTTLGGTWSCAGYTTIVSVGSSSGIVTGLSAGTAVVSYILPSGCYSVATVVVYAPPGPVTGVAVTCVGSTTTLYEPGAGVWISSAPGVATIGSSSGVVTGVTTGSALITYSVAPACFATFPVTVTAVPVPITGTVNICPGATYTLTDAVPGGYWTSGSPGIATVGSASGVVTGVSGGTALISYATAPGAGCVVSTAVSISPPPGPIGGVASICAGQTTLLTDGGGGTWSSGATGVATIGSASGIATGVAAGTAVITYTLPAGCSITTVLTVNSLPLPITGSAHICIGSSVLYTDATPGGYWTSSDIAVSDIDAGTGVALGFTTGVTTISYSLMTGCFATLTVTVDSLPVPIAGPSTVCVGSLITLTDGLGGGLWTSGTPSVATIGSTTGVVSGLTGGTTTITYSPGASCRVTKVITVNPLPTIILGPVSVCIGATITLINGTPGGAWSKSNANVNIGSVSGIVTGVSGGTTVITYTLPTGCYMTKTITVNSSTGAITGSLGICLGTTSPLSSTSTGGVWSSSSPAIAAIGSSSGIASGIALGTATISYSVGTGCLATAVVTVSAFPSNITGLSAVCAGSSIPLFDTIGGGTWSTAGGIATVGSSSGVVTGVAAGIAVITYALPSGCYKTKTITVNASPAPITGTTRVCSGATTLLSDAVAGGTWSSSTPTIAMVGSASGLVIGVGTGLATITYAFSTGCMSTITVTVNAMPLPITGLSAVCAGGATIGLGDPTPGGTWSTTGSAATVGSSSGIVTGVSAGIAVITYAMSTGCLRTMTVNVNPVPAPIGGPSAVCVGATIMLTESTPAGFWTSGTTSVATIGSTSGIVTGFSIGTTNISYTLSSGCRSVKTVTVSTTPGSITGVSTVCTGATTTLFNAVPGGLWISAGTGVATIGSLTGVVTGVTAGTTLVTYSLGTGCIVTKTMSVTPSPAAIAGSNSLCQLSTTTLTDATPGGAWTSGTTSVATVGATSGLVTALSPGTAAITYTISSTGCTASMVVTVSSVPTAITGPGSVCTGASVTEVDGVAGGTWSTSGTAITIGTSSGVVTGVASGTAVVTYAIGTTSSFPGCMVTRTVTVNTVSPISGATGVCVGGTTMLTDLMTGGTWASATPGVATIGSSTGITTGVTPGSTLITYTAASGCTATITVTVSSGPAPIAGATQVCIAGSTILTDAAGGGLWFSSSTGIATVGSLSGLVTGVTAGVVNITYSLGTGCTTTRPMTVNPLPAAITGAASVCVGSSTLLGCITPGGTWSSAAPGTAGIGSLTGMVSGLAAGTAVISYTLSTGCAATRIETVNTIPTGITGTATVCVGQTTLLSEATVGGFWSSSAAGIADVGSLTGIVSGITAGTAVITYTVPDGGGCFTTRIVTVNPIPPAIVGASSLCAGATTTLTDGLTGGMWSSSPTGIADIGSSTGIVSGTAAGTAVISYTSPAGCAITRLITVNPIPLAITGVASVCIGTSTALADVTPGGVWTSSNLVIATVGTGTGLVSGVNTGTANITYATGLGCMTVRTVTVYPSPPVITGPNHLCVGQTITLSDSATGGSWMSGSTGIATVGATSGAVTGAAGGVTTISYTVPVTGCVVTYPVTVNSVPPITGLTNLCAWGDTLTVHDANPAGSYSCTSVTIVNLGGGNGRITANAPGTCTVTYTLTSGCSITSTFTVNPLPGLITGNLNLCPGTTSTLGNAVGGGAWTSSILAIATIGSASGIAAGIAPGTSHITYTLPTGCRADTVLHVNTPPSMIIGYPTLVVGTTASYTDMTPGGLWSSSNVSVATIGAGTGLVHGVTVGSVTITYTMGSGCFATKLLAVHPFVGVNPDDVTNTTTAATTPDIAVSPNPNTGTFALRGSVGVADGDEDVWLEIADMPGRTVFRKKIRAVGGLINEQVTLSDDMANGMYLLRIQHGGAGKVLHLVLKR